MKKMINGAEYHLGGIKLKPVGIILRATFILTLLPIALIVSVVRSIMTVCNYFIKDWTGSKKWILTGGKLDE